MISFLKKRWHIVLELLFIVVISLIPLLWFKSDHMIIGYDSGYPIDYSLSFFQRLFTWQSTINFGVDFTSFIGHIPLHAILALVNSLGFGHYNVQKITFVFWFFAISLSMYAFITSLYSLKKFWIIRITAVTFYSINLFIFSFWINGEQTTLSLFALLPLVLMTILLFLKNKISPISSAVLLNIFYLVFNAGAILGVPLMGAILFPAIFLIIFYVIKSIKEDIFIFSIKRIALFLFLFLVICIFLNAYFLIPYIISIRYQFSNTVISVGGIDAAIQWTDAISKFANFHNLIRLQGDPNWFENQNFYSNYYLKNPLLILYSFLVPILVFSSYILEKRKEKRTLISAFLLIIVIGIFLSAGTHAPFGQIYSFFMKHIPGFAAFRSAYYKFIPILLFSYATLFSISIYYLLEKISFKKIRIICAVLVIGSIFLYNFPFFDNRNFDFERPFSLMVHIPNYIKDFENYDIAHEQNYRTLVVPQLSIFPITALTWGYWSPTPIFSGLTNNTYLLNDSYLHGKEPQLLNQMYDAIREEDVEKFLKIARVFNVKRLLVRRDAAYGYQKAPTENPKDYEKYISDMQIFSLAKKFGPWELYTFQDKDNQKIIGTSHLEKFSGDLSSIFPLLASQDGFVYDEDYSDFLKPFILYGESTIPCLSCKLTPDNQELPKLSVPRIIPGSTFYGLKVFRDQLFIKRNTDLMDKLNSYMSLSLKRAGEFTYLNIDTAKNIDQNDWINASELLSSYLLYMNTNFPTLVKNGQYDALIAMYRPLNIIRASLEKVYEEIGPANNLKKYLANNIWQAKEIHRVLGKLDILNPSILSYVTSVDRPTAFFIDKNSLPKGSSGEYVPISIYLNKKKISYETTGNSLVVSVPKGHYLLQIRFENLSVIDNFEMKQISTPDETYNCLYSPIEDYKWYQRYLISSDLRLPTGNEAIFIKEYHDEFKTANSFVSRNNYFTPSYTVSISKNNDSIFGTFKGPQDSYYAEIYYCTPEGFFPQEKFINPIIFPEVLPKIYTKNKYKDNTGSAPLITFEKNSPTHYTVHVTNAEEPFVISFLERFSPLWTLKINNEVVNSKHFQINGYANGWVLNKKGSYILSIDFSSQKYFYMGIIISGFSLVVLIASTLYIFLKKQHGKKN